MTEDEYIDKTPKYASGKSDEYYEFEVDGEKIRVHKPKHPLDELKEQGKKLPGDSLKEKIYWQMEKCYNLRNKLEDEKEKLRKLWGKLEAEK